MKNNETPTFPKNAVITNLTNRLLYRRINFSYDDRIIHFVVSSFKVRHTGM